MSQFLTTYLKKLKQIGIERNIPNITEQNAGFLKGYIANKNPKHFLEIGTANGYSALQFSQVLDNDATLTTIEYAWNAHIEAVEHFKNCKIKRIHAIWGDAKLVLPTLREDFFDCIYIDAMKREYLQYLQLSLPLATKDAIIIIDDVEKFRDKMRNLYEFLDKNHIPYTIEKTDEDDSIMLLFASDCRI